MWWWRTDWLFGCLNDCFAGTIIISKTKVKFLSSLQALRHCRSVVLKLCWLWVSCSAELTVTQRPVPASSPKQFSWTANESLDMVSQIHKICITVWSSGRSGALARWRIVFETCQVHFAFFDFFFAFFQLSLQGCSATSCISLASVNPHIFLCCPATLSDRAPELCCVPIMLSGCSRLLLSQHASAAADCCSVSDRFHLLWTPR